MSPWNVLLSDAAAAATATAAAAAAAIVVVVASRVLARGTGEMTRHVTFSRSQLHQQM